MFFLNTNYSQAQIPDLSGLQNYLNNPTNPLNTTPSSTNSDLPASCQIGGVFQADDLMEGFKFNKNPNPSSYYNILFTKDDYVLTDAYANNEARLSNLNNLKNIFVCLSDAKNYAGLAKPIAISVPSNLNITSGSDLIPLINDYQKKNGLTQNGKMDVQTSYLLGHHVGQIYKKYKGSTNTDCNQLNIAFVPGLTMTQDSPTANLDALNKAASCSYGSSGFLSESILLSIRDFFSNDNKLANGSEILFGNEENLRGGIALMFQIGFQASIRGASLDSTPSDEPFDATNIEQCYQNLNFTNDDLFLETTAKQPRNITTAIRALLCANQYQSFTEDLPSDTSTSIADLNKLVTVFQQTKMNDYDQETGLFKTGTLGVDTAFEIGSIIGKAYRIKHPDIVNSEGIQLSCNTANISFTKSHSISANNEGFYPNNSTSNIVESKANEAPLTRLLSCLRSTPHLAEDTNPINNPIDFLTSNPYFKDKLINNRAGINILFELGKDFEKYGGEQNLFKTENTLDPCLKNTTDLEQQIHSYNAVNFVPRNPGLIDWRSVTEEGSTECLTDTKLAASLIGRVIRFFEAFVGVIAVLIFIYGGFLYIIAHGDEAISGKGLNAILIGTGGIFIILMSRFITEILIPVSEDGMSIDQSKAFSDTTIANAQIAQITNWLLGFASFIVISMLIYGGYLWLASSGDEGLVDKAKKIVTSSLIGFLIVFSAYTITMVILGGAGITN